MKTVKFLSTIAITFLMGLIYLIVTLENPLDQKYNEIVQRIMEEEELDSEHEILSQFPEIEKLKAQIQEIKKMHYDIEQVTQHPIPPNEKQSVQLLKKMDTLKKMKEEVQLQINQITLKTVKSEQMVIMSNTETTVEEMVTLHVLGSKAAPK